MKRYNFLIILLIQFVHQVQGQSFLPQPLDKTINSSYDEINPVISPDGKTLYFVRVNHPENTFGSENSEDIWYSELQSDGTWAEAKRISSLNIGRYNAILSVSADGNTALLNGVYNKKGNIWKKRGLSISTKTGEQWSTPEKLKVKKLSKRNRGLKSNGTMSADGQYLILSFSRVYNSRKTNLFLCKRKENGKWGRPKPIRALNSPRSEITPFLLADNKTLYFAGDYYVRGQFDLYKATRSGNNWKEWSEPVKLSDTINSPGWEAYLKTNTRGSVAHFSSTNKTIGDADIFKVKLFEENPFVVVSGRIVHAKSHRPLIGKTIAISANHTTPDSVYVNPDSATYKVTLPLKKVYELAAEVNHYKPVPATVDVSAVREFTKMKLDLLVNPLPYVLVKGNMLVRNTGASLPMGSSPKIYVNGQPFDSVSISMSDGTYTMKLPHGLSYTLQLSARNYDSQPKTLNLTEIDEYQEIPFDLVVDEEKMALVSGKIIDKKTGRVIAATLPVNIKVEGLSSVIAKVDPQLGTYEVKLPLGSSHTISANASDYYPLYEIVDLTHEKTNVKIYKDLVIAPIEVGQSIKLNNVFFESGKAALKKESFPELDRVAEFMSKNPDLKIEIGGHTDNVGKVATNKKLSESRAKAVAAYIISKGIPKANIVSKGYGSAKPVDSNKTAKGKAQNRRVEFTILDK